MDIQNIIEQLKAAKMPADIIDYVFENSTVLTTSYFYEYEKMLNIMFSHGLELDHKYMMNVYQIAVQKGYVYYLFYFFRSQTVKVSNDIKIDLLVKAGMTKFNAIMSLLENENYYQPNIFNEYIDILSKDLETDFFNYFATVYNSGMYNYITKALLEKDYDKYIDVVKNKFGKQTHSYTNDTFVLNLIKDDIFIEDYFIAKTILFVKAKADASTAPDVERCLVNYLKDAAFEKDFDVVISKFLKRFGKYDTVFYNTFLKGFNLDLSKQFHKNIFNLSVKLDLKDTLIDFVKFSYEKKPENIDNLEKAIKSGIPKASLFQFLIEKQADSSYYKSIEEQIIYMVENYYDDCVEGVKNSSNEGIFFGMKYLFEADKEKSFDFILSFVDNKSKSIIRGVVITLSGYNKLEEYKKLLNSKKAQPREIGVRLIASLGINNETSKLFKEIIAKDKSGDVTYAAKEYFENIKKINAENRVEFVKTFTKVEFTNESKEKYSKCPEFCEWIFNENMPEILWTDKTKLESEVIYQLLEFYKKNPEILFEKEKLISLIDKESLRIYGKKLFEIYLKNNNIKATSSENPEEIKTVKSRLWVFDLISFFGATLIEKELIEIIDDLIKCNITDELTNAFVKTLAMSPSYKSYRFLDTLAYLQKGKNISYAITSAISNAYYILKIPYEKYELLRMPNFGFVHDKKLHLDYGTRNFIIGINKQIEFTIVDNNGKSFKNLPKPGKNDNEKIAKQSEELFSNLKKEIKDFLKAKKDKMIAYMTEKRLMSFEDFKYLFMENPIMTHFSNSLVFGVYDDDKKLIKTFLFMEDGSFIDENGDDFKLNETDKISIVHPIDLTKEIIDKWKQIIADYEIEQPFRQIDRSVYVLTDENKNNKSIDDFKDKKILSITLWSKLTNNLGWSRGSVEDGGWYYNFYKHVGGIYVYLEFSGSDVSGYDKFSEVTVGSLTFSGKTLGEMSPLVISEIYNEIKSVVG